jgi:excisionase family DNA binding protein
MYDRNRIVAEKFIYAFTGMSLSEYTDNLLKEFQNEVGKIYKKLSSVDNNFYIDELRREISNLGEKDILYTVTETAKLIKSNPTYVYSLIKAGLLPALKLGSFKIRRTTLIDFLNKYEKWDVSDPSNPRPIAF